MGSLLLTDGNVITVDPQRRVLPRGYILIVDGRIAALGPMQEIGDVRSDETIALGGKTVVPGLINLHDHHWAGLLKGTDDGLHIVPWLEQVFFPLMFAVTKDDLRVAAYLAAIEALHTGTTTFVNHLVTVSDHEAFAAMAEPGREVGIRQLIAKDVRHTPDPPFYGGRPAHPHVRSLDDEIALAEEIVERWHGDSGRVHVGLAVETSNFYMLSNVTSEETIHRALELARRSDLRISNHLGVVSSPEFEQLTGGGDVDFLDRMGALDERWIFVHSIGVTPVDLHKIAEAGASCAICCSSNAFRGGFDPSFSPGVPPLRDMLDAGVNVGIGSDGSYSSGTLDMVEHMKFTALMQNAIYSDGGVVSAERALEMATINAARALGMEDEIGSLEIGKRADISVFDLDRSHNLVTHRPVSGLVHSAHGTDVDTVIVDGRVVLRDGTLVFPDTPAVRREARERAAALIERAGLSSRIRQEWRPVAGHHHPVHAPAAPPRA